MRILFTLFLMVCSFELPLVAQNSLVKVQLNNSQEIEGVVLNRDLKKNSLSKKLSSSEAGIRLWYVGNNKGFLFINFGRIEKLVSIISLKEKDLRDIIRKVRKEKRQRKEARHKEEQSTEKLLPTDSKKEDEKTEESQEEEKEILEEEKIILAIDIAFSQVSYEHRQWLNKYPPSEGWGKKRYEKYAPRIARNKQLGNPYNGIPKELVNFDYDYEKWEKALEIWTKKTQKILGKKIDIAKYISNEKDEEKKEEKNS